MKHDNMLSQHTSVVLVLAFAFAAYACNTGPRETASRSDEARIRTPASAEPGAADDTTRNRPDASDHAPIRVERAELARLPTPPSPTRVLPSIEQGETRGFELNAIPPDSLFARVGFENGDAVTAVNGHPFTTPDQALEAYHAVKEERELAIDIIRRGKPITLRVVIED